MHRRGDSAIHDHRGELRRRRRRGHRRARRGAGPLPGGRRPARVHRDRPGPRVRQEPRAQLGAAARHRPPAVAGAPRAHRNLRASASSVRCSPRPGKPAPPAERDTATAATSALAAAAGAWCVRVHDVEGTLDAVKVATAWANPAAVPSGALGLSMAPRTGGPRDTISVTGITATGHHGVFDHEKRDGQPFVVDVVLHTDIRPAAASDDLADTANYGALAGRVADLVGSGPYDLIETLAERLAGMVLAEFAVEAVGSPCTSRRRPSRSRSATWPSPSTGSALERRRPVDPRPGQQPGRAPGHALARRGGPGGRGRRPAPGGSEVVQTKPVGGPAGPAGLPEHGRGGGDVPRAAGTAPALPGRGEPAPPRPRGAAGTPHARHRHHHLRRRRPRDARADPAAPARGRRGRSCCSRGHGWTPPRRWAAPPWRSSPTAPRTAAAWCPTAPRAGTRP